MVGGSAKQPPRTPTCATEDGNPGYEPDPLPHPLARGECAPTEARGDGGATLVHEGLSLKGQARGNNVYLAEPGAPGLPAGHRASILRPTMGSRPLILLSNDDGYRAAGLMRLREAIMTMADVVVVAPEREQSAASHAISLSRPLRFAEVGPNIFAVDGTPVDCVYTALYSGQRLLPARPSLVVAGLNHGVNLGDDVFYSGTVAAAREGALRGCRAMAFSADEGANVAAAVELAARLVFALLEDADQAPVLLNVNFPRGSEWPVVSTCLGSRVYQDGVEVRRDPRGREYLWLGGPPGTRHAGGEDADTVVFDRGMVGVTPLALHLWESREMSRAERVAARVRP